MDVFDLSLTKAAHRNCCCVRLCRSVLKRPTKRRFCRRCRERRYAALNPVAYAFAKLRWNAKRRGHQFTLTIEQFDQFCTWTNYIALKGKHGAALSIDRIRAHEGYTADNIQVLTLAENSRKAHHEGAYAPASSPDPFDKAAPFG